MANPGERKCAADPLTSGAPVHPGVLNSATKEPAGAVPTMCAAGLLAGDRGTLCAPGGAITGLTGPVIPRITSVLWAAVTSPPGRVIPPNSGSQSPAPLAGRASPAHPGVP